MSRELSQSSLLLPGTPRSMCFISFDRLHFFGPLESEGQLFVDETEWSHCARSARRIEHNVFDSLKRIDLYCMKDSGIGS